MTVATTYSAWPTTSPLVVKIAAERRCSPNLVALGVYLRQRWGGQDLGCYQVRPVRGGTTPSVHSYGAAKDWRYADPGPGRAVAVAEIIPWLLAASAELGIDAVHDYVGCRIWHAGRGWKTQKANTGTGMGQTWAGWLHIETHPERWYDTRPIPARTPPPAPTPALAPVVAQQSEEDPAMWFVSQWEPDGTWWLISPGLDRRRPISQVTAWGLVAGGSHKHSTIAVDLLPEIPT